MCTFALGEIRRDLSWPISFLGILLIAAACPLAGARGSQPGPGVEAKIRQELKNPTTMEFIETPLQDTVDYLKELHGIEIQLDVKAMNEASVGCYSLVSRTLKGLSLASALSLMLHDLDLTMVVTDGVLLITTPEAAGQMIETRIYDVGDIATAVGDVEKLAQGLRTLLTVADNVPEIVPYQKLLLVRAAIPVHEELARLLPEIRDKLKTPAK